MRTPQNDRRRAVAALLAALLLAGMLPAAPAVAEGHDDEPPFGPQIVGGEPDTSGAQPWAAALLADAGDANTAFCGGTLVAPRWVLTAAHCFDNRSPAGTDVLLGTVHLTDPGEVRTVVDAVEHPDYDPDSDEFHDVALLRLDAAAGVTPLPLAEAERPGTHAPGITASAWGWGNIALSDEDPVFPETVHRVDLPILSDPDCEEGLLGDYAPQTMLCAGTLAGPGDRAIDTCDGDSGGPLAVPADGAWLLAGVTSFGVAGCGEAPGVYMRATAYNDWIVDQIGPLARARAAGVDRINTSVAAARAGWETADTALVATAADFADALAGAGLAAALDAPLLLTRPGALPQPVANTLTDFEVDEVLVLGGPAAVDDGVLDAIAGLPGGPAVERVAGRDRYGTAAAAAVAAGAPGGVAIAAGEVFADAVSAATFSAGAAGQRRPILLAEADGLPEDTLDALADLEVNDAYVVGGPARLEEGVFDDLSAAGVAASRVAGPDRYATSQAVIEEHADAFDAPYELIAATGENFPDALAAGALAAARGGPVLLVPPNPHAATEAWVEGWADRLQALRLLGGPAAVGDPAWRAIQDAATR